MPPVAMLHLFWAVLPGDTVKLAAKAGTEVVVVATLVVVATVVVVAGVVVVVATVVVAGVVVVVATVVVAGAVVVVATVVVGAVVVVVGGGTVGVSPHAPNASNRNTATHMRCR